MGLFDKISGALSDPNLQANVNQIGGIVSALQQTSQSQGLDANTSQTLLSVVGKQVRSSLQSQRQQSGTSTVQQLIEQFGGTQPNSQAVDTLLSPQQREAAAAEGSQKTGVSAQQIQALLPVLVPLVLNFLKTGNNSQNAQASTNPVLSGFLDADSDGDVDVGDALNLASRFLQR